MMKKYLFLLFQIGLSSFLYAQDRGNSIKEYGLFNVCFPDYLSQHDIVYLDPDYDGFNGFPLGNGDLGGMVWCNEDGLQVQINKIDLYDRPKEDLMTLRAAGQLKIDFGVPCFNYLYLDNFEGRLSLARAEATYKASTAFSDIQVKSWVDAHSNVWVFDCEGSYGGTIAGGAPVTVSLDRWGSRVFNGWYNGYGKDVSAGLGKTKSRIVGNTICLEDSLDGGLRFVVACRILGKDVTPQLLGNRKVSLTKSVGKEQKCTIALAVVTSDEASNPLEEAIRLLNETEQNTVARTKQKHHEWWREFWERSFVHLDNNYMENIYYLRRYLMASSSRGEYLSPFNGGLWVWNRDIRQWCTPHHWNTQESYWGLGVQNDCDLMMPYLKTYFRLMDRAGKYAESRGIKNAILWNEAHDFSGNMVGAEWGNMVNNFTPASQMAGIFWEYFQFSQDKECLRDTIYPFMKRTAEFYLQYLKWDSTKKEYYIFPSQPYEHAENSQLKNCITDRYMIESLFKNCIEAAVILQCDSKKVKAWKNVVAHLWAPPVLVAPGIGKVFGTAFYPDGRVYPEPEQYNSGQYHFDAHTTQVFPAGVLGLNQKGSEEFSIAENIALHHPAEKNAITPGPIVAARLGLGNQVLKDLSNNIRRLQHFKQGLFYNLDHWYLLSSYAGKVPHADVATQRDYIYDSRISYSNSDAGKSGLAARPFIQCGMEPLGIYGAAVNEMLIQSHEGKVRIFPAVPDNWEGAFSLLARGAFVVSSIRDKKGYIPGVEIVSKKGNVFRIESPWPGQKVLLLCRDERMNYDQEGGVITFRTKENERYLLFVEGKQPKGGLLYTSVPNQYVKKFDEAELGKERTFNTMPTK